MAVIETAIAAAATTAATKALFTAASDRVEKTVKGPTRMAFVKALAALASYAPYLQETNDRVSTFKTFADPTKPVSLLSHFVTTKLAVKGAKRTIDQDGLVSRLKRPGRFVVSATAGFGKSMVMRYIALSMFEKPNGRIPIFLELRHLNRVTSPNIINYIHSSYRRTGDVQVESFRQGLAAGAFALLLDGFDELNHELRPIIEEQILRLTREYPSCSIIVSGRPDDRFISWRDFTVFKIKPMEKPQVIELIEKLDYDKGVRKRFIDKIKDGLYESHESFLSTPLLAILMLLTFEQNANIPDKIYLFYGEAFKTLFHKHDALKEQYDRSRKSGLAVDDFERVFSVLCLKTYVQEKTEFTRNEIVAAIKDALAFEGHNVKPDDFLFDVEEAVCLMMREGASYFFVHRSFQEFFTAVFLSNCDPAIRDEFIGQVATRYWDTVLPMLFDMASSQIEPTWVANNIEEYLLAVGYEENKLPPFSARFNTIRLFKDDNGAHLLKFDFGPYFRFVAVMMRFYPQVSVSEPLSFAPFEKWALSNWGGLLEKYKVRAANKSQINEMVDIPFADIPLGVIEETNLPKMADREYQEIVAISQNLDKTQLIKNNFLEKLFPSKKLSE